MTASPRTQVLLATQRLILRPLEASDAEAMLHYRADPAVCLCGGRKVWRLGSGKSGGWMNVTRQLGRRKAGWHKTWLVTGRTAGSRTRPGGHAG